MKNYYEILGVARDVGAAELKQAYRRLASQYHPDKGGDTQKFQEIEEAYRVLSDPQQRQQYDNPRAHQHNNVHFDHNDLFAMFAELRRQQQARPVHLQLSIELRDVAFGGKKVVLLRTSQGAQSLELELPVGVNTGDSVRYANLAPGGQDLIVQYVVRPSDQWQRSGDNLITDLPVTIWDLLLGNNVTVTTILDQQISVNVPAMTQPGTMLRVRGHGLPNKNNTKGDLLLKIIARLPDSVPDELLEQIRVVRGQ